MKWYDWVEETNTWEPRENVKNSDVVGMIEKSCIAGNKRKAKNVEDVLVVDEVKKPRKSSLPVRKLPSMTRSKQKIGRSNFVDIIQNPVSKVRERDYYDCKTIKVLPVRGKDVIEDDSTVDFVMDLFELRIGGYKKDLALNEGQKQLMRIWNSFMVENRHSFTGSCHMLVSLEVFVKLEGVSIVNQNLTGNFMVHVCNLYNFGVIS